ncbi:MAG: terminase small subunit [Pseudomonadota bacterium]|nr:terminase small subunit [Pseudomonadota bacterium]
MAKLRAKQQRFVDEYLIDLNATQAAIRAGYSARTAEQMAYQLLQKTSVQDAIADRQADLSRRTEITQDMVLDRLWAQATANPNELIRYRRVNCRYCWGEDHYYQWTAAEYYNAKTKAEENKKNAPDCDGGFGFDKTRPPHPDCPECKGEGLGDIFIADTNKLAGAAALLYAGVKTTRDGIQVLMHDQQNALIRVGQHLGMFVERKLHGNDPDNPIIPTKEMIEDEVDRRIAELERKAKAGR